MKKEAGSKNSTLAIVGFVFAVLFFIPILPFIGAILGTIALFKIKKNPQLKGKGLAISSIIIGVIVIIVQIIIFILIMSAANTITGVLNKSPGESISYCLEQKPGPSRDVCILLAVAANVNATDQIDKNVCNNNVQNSDIKNLCNAMLTKDRKYCDQIQNAKTKTDCYDLVAQLQTQY